MNAQSDAVSKVFEQVIETFRKTAETGLSAQKELFQLWQNNLPDLGRSQPPWLDQMRQFQRAWSDTVLDLTRKHRDILDRQYEAGIDALKEAFSMSESNDPETFRKRAEELCRKNLDCLKEISEAQIREFQTATTEWVDALTKGVSPEKGSSKD
jgi:hypothetical protein